MEIVRIAEQDDYRVAEVLFRGEDRRTVADRVVKLEEMADGKELFWRTPKQDGPYVFDPGGAMSFDYLDKQGARVGACAYLKLEKPEKP